MNITISQETQNDHQAVFNVIEHAFATEAMSDHQEQFLVERLRKSSAFVPELSIIAEVEEDGQFHIVGHILLTKIRIKNDKKSFESLALAPVSVLPEFHGKGIGGKLITHAHEVARELGFQYFSPSCYSDTKTITHVLATVPRWSLALKCRLMYLLKTAWQLN